jgi:hypothetical protein
MLVLAALLAQAAAPDIEVNVRATVREVRVTRRGETSLRVYASPDAGSRAGAPRPAGERQTRGRNATVNIHAEARIADPRANSPAPETSPPN